MKTIKNSKDITTLEVGDKVIFGDLKYKVCHEDGYFLQLSNSYDYDKIFTILNISKRDFVKNLGINTLTIDWDFPEVQSLEALTAIVSALFKEYEKQKELPKTWEEFCERIPIKGKETFINSASDLVTLKDYTDRTFRLCGDDKNLCTSKQEAEAFLALMQLRQLRKAYVKDWEPDGTKGYWGIYLNHLGTIRIIDTITHLKVLSFPTYKLAEQFAHNFKNLLKIANPLL